MTLQLYDTDSEKKKELLGISGELSDVEKRYSLNALRIFKERYLLKDNDGNTVERLDDLFRRVAVASGIMEVLYDPLFYDKDSKLHVDEEGREWTELDIGRYEDNLKAITVVCSKTDYKNLDNHYLNIPIGSFKINLFHRERLLARYLELAREGKIKVEYEEILKKLQEKEFQDKYLPIIQKYYDLMANNIFLPNTPCLMNAGTKLNQNAACFTLNIEDDLDDIYKTYWDIAKVFKSGGGIGINYSKLRPEGAFIKSTGGKSSGTISWLKGTDETTGRVAQGGKRRGAAMGILDMDHPEIEKFIDLKDNKTLENHNISICTPSYFFKGLLSGGERERYLMDKITKNVYLSGDPGAVFLENMNSNNLLLPVFDRPIKVTNPCFSPDTLIETVQGQIKIKDIKEPIRVYTCDENGKLTTAMASASWKSKENAETLDITMNNGRTLTVTPEHKLLKIDFFKSKREWIEAKDLKVGDSIVSLCRARRGACYSGIKLSTEDNRSYRMEHRFIYEESFGVIEEGFDIHHIDGDTYNNSLDNIELMLHEEHARLTALTQPNNHQVISGNRFVTHPNSRRGQKTIIPMPDHLRSNHPHQPMITSIKKGENMDVYDISVEKYNCLIANGVVAHNCSEISMYPYESCILASINLTQFIKDGKFDLEKFIDVSRTVTAFLDGIIDATNYPLPEINKMTRDCRRVGTGFMGLADVMTMLKIPYNSKEGFLFAEFISAVMTMSALLESNRQAKVKGAFPLWYDEKYPKDKLPVNSILNGKETIKQLKDKFSNIYKYFSYQYLQDNNLYDIIMDSYILLASNGSILRNCSVTTIAPTGTLSMFADCSSALEPNFSNGFIKKVTLGEFEYVNHYLKDALEKEGIYSKQLADKIIKENGGSVQGIEEIPEWIRQVFVTAMDIHPFDHIMMQSVCQRWISNGIAKTINVPEDFDEKLIEYCYILSWALGNKGVTVYRDNSKDIQVLNNSSKHKVGIQDTSYYTYNYIGTQLEFPDEYHSKILDACYPNHKPNSEVDNLVNAIFNDIVEITITGDETEQVLECSSCGAVTKVQENGKACFLCFQCGSKIGSCE